MEFSRFGFDSRIEGMWARADVWLPLLAGAAMLGLVAMQVGRNSGRLQVGDFVRGSRPYWWLVTSLVALSGVAGVGTFVAGSVVLRAAASPAGYEPLPVHVEWAWLVIAAALVLGRLAADRRSTQTGRPADLARRI